MQRNSKIMRILDEIKKRIFRFGEVLSYNRAFYYFDGFDCTKHQFANVIWYNICDLQTDLIEDVQIKNLNTNLRPLEDEGMKFVMFKQFVYIWGKTVLQRLYDEGFVVIGHDNVTQRFWQMENNEYSKVTENGVTIPKPLSQNVDIYVMKSATYVAFDKSDKEICKGFLDFLDDVLNGSATVSRRLGAVVVASPKNLPNAPIATVLTDDQKIKIEKEMREDYGSLSKQSNLMLLPREMNLQTINLSGLDLKMQEKVKTAILAIVDRIKIPANQVAIIDAQSSKSLANGGEIREGDKLKYKSFRRLFERSFADMARYYGLKIEYIIDGEPIGKDAEINTNE